MLLAMNTFVTRVALILLGFFVAIAWALQTILGSFIAFATDRHVPGFLREQVQIAKEVGVLWLRALQDPYAYNTEDDVNGA